MGLPFFIIYKLVRLAGVYFGWKTFELLGGRGGVERGVGFTGAYVNLDERCKHVPVPSVLGLLAMAGMPVRVEEGPPE